MSSEGYSSCEEDHLEPLRFQISACLDEIHSAGSFATAGYNVNHIHPGLGVKGVGPIRLPLHPEDANALIQVSRQSTSDKEEKAVARETVRKTWEIDGEELSFGNEDWNSWLYQIVVKVRKGLGIPRGAGSIRAELSKLVVYEEGAFSKPQEDTEMTRNMFGTLEICLPSEHVGGGVRLIQGHAERVLETDKSSSYGVSYLAQGRGGLENVSSSSKGEPMMGDFVRRFLDEEAFTAALLVEVLCRAQTVQETDLMEHLLPVILHPAVSSFQLQQFSSRQKRDPHSSKVYPFSSWSRCRLSAQDRGKQDAAVVMSLYRRLAKDDLNMAGQLLKTIANDIATIYDDDLDPFIIPLLREMIDITTLQPAEASRFYSEAISTYIERKITRKPPKPQDWSLPNDFVECSRPGCKSRFEVREFLNDPDKEEQAFYVPEYRYKEVQEHFPDHYLIKRGSRREHRVRVTKSHGSWGQQYNQWQIRVDHAQHSLRSLPETQLRQCLGDARYMDLMELRNVRVQSKEEPIPRGMEAEPTQFSGPVARKRKRE
ncbi:hypothetical protein ABEF95_011722 [Exophiala dermatitidis]